MQDFCSEQFSDDEIRALWICTLVAAFLSVIGSSFMLENFFLYDKGRDPLTKLVAWLAFGDYATAVNNIIKTLMLLRYPDLYSWEVCVVMRAWFQIVSGSTWCYTSVIAFFLYRFMSTRDTNWITWPIWLAFHLCSWGVPTIGVIVMVAGNFIYRSDNTGLCYPTEPWHIILWFIPIIFSFIWMLFCYTSIIWRIVRSNHSASSSRLSINPSETMPLTTVPENLDPETLFQEKENAKRGQLRKIALRFSFYILVFFICWFFDVVTYFILFFNENCNVYFFVFGYTLFRNLQGMLDCLVYGMTNLKIRKRFTRSILSAIVSMWELLLSPMLVLPASVAYFKKLIQPFFSSDKSDKIFVSINDELMKERRVKFSKKVPSYYFSDDLDDSWERRSLERKEQRAKRREERRKRREDLNEQAKAKAEHFSEELQEEYSRPISSLNLNDDSSVESDSTKGKKKRKNKSRSEGKRNLKDDLEAQATTTTKSWPDSVNEEPSRPLLYEEKEES